MFSDQRSRVGALVSAALPSIAWNKTRHSTARFLARLSFLNLGLGFFSHRSITQKKRPVYAETPNNGSRYSDACVRHSNLRTLDFTFLQSRDVCKSGLELAPYRDDVLGQLAENASHGGGVQPGVGPRDDDGTIAEGHGPAARAAAAHCVWKLASSRCGRGRGASSRAALAV